MALGCYNFHLHPASLSPVEFLAIALRNPVNTELLHRLRDLRIPQCHLTAGWQDVLPRNSLYSLGSIDLRVGAGARRGLDGAPRWWAALHIGGAGDVRSRGWLVEGRQAERACRSRMLRIPAVDTTSRGWGAWSLLTHNCAALQTITPIVCCTEVR